MMTRRFGAVVIVLGLALASFGEEMATLRWSGDGEFMGWRWEKLDEPFEDGAARFAAESRIVSPTECIICGCGGSR